MKQTTMSIRVDEDIKFRFDAFCASIGVNSSAAINMFIHAALRENSIPFALKGDEDKINAEWLKNALIRKGVPRVTLEMDENGNAIIDKVKHPDVYDWAVNG